MDPGLGFAKRAEHNWALLAHLDDLAALGRPVLVGASRKGFLGRLLAGADGSPRPAERARGRHHRGVGAGRRRRRLGGAGARGARDAGRRRGGRRRPAVPQRLAGTVTHPETGAVLQANQALYDAFETGDIDLMGALWLDGPDAGDRQLHAPRAGRR